MGGQGDALAAPSVGVQREQRADRQAARTTRDWIAGCHGRQRRTRGGRGDVRAPQGAFLHRVTWTSPNGPTGERRRNTVHASSLWRTSYAWITPGVCDSRPGPTPTRPGSSRVDRYRAPPTAARCGAGAAAAPAFARAGKSPPRSLIHTHTHTHTHTGRASRAYVSQCCDIRSTCDAWV
jgi:hypothetical protein